MPARTPPFRLPVITCVVGGLLLLLLVSAAASAGLPGVLTVAGIAALITGLYVLATGRASWALVPSRGLGGAVIGCGIVLALIGAALAPSSPDADRAATTTVPTVSAGATASESPAAGMSPEPAPSAAASPTPVATAMPTDPVVAPAQKPTANSDPSALALLATLPVHAAASMADYDREADFGRPWVDVDDNGCDTRNDILARDLKQVTKSGRCTVLSGVLADPYTATTIDFLRGVKTSSLVQIDHVVALGDAWQTGAKKLSEAQRIALANDPLNLLAVQGRANSQKQDSDASDWLPANISYRCAYVARQVSVKVTYRLWVTSSERAAMQSVLSSCPDERASASAPIVNPAPAPQPAPAPAPKPATSAPAPDVYYKNCTAVRDAGEAPLHRGDPGYRSGLDRDGDGVACE